MPSGGRPSTGSTPSSGPPSSTASSTSPSCSSSTSRIRSGSASARTAGSTTRRASTAPASSWASCSSRTGRSSTGWRATTSGGPRCWWWRSSTSTTSSWMPSSGSCAGIPTTRTWSTSPLPWSQSEPPRTKPGARSGPARSSSGGTGACPWPGPASASAAAADAEAGPGHGHAPVPPELDLAGPERAPGFVLGGSDCDHGSGDVDHVLVVGIPAQLPDEGIHDEVVDVDDRHHQQRGPPDVVARQPVELRPVLEEHEAQDEAGAVEARRVVEPAVRADAEPLLILDVEDEHDGEVLEAVEDGGPDEGVEPVEGRPPDGIGEDHHEADGG